MNSFSKALLVGVGLTGAMLAGGCASRYYDDDGYYRRDHTTYYRDHDGRRDSGRDTERVRVCDADGDDCHWEYRRR